MVKNCPNCNLLGFTTTPMLIHGLPEGNLFSLVSPLQSLDNAGSNFERTRRSSSLLLGMVVSSCFKQTWIDDHGSRRVDQSP